MQILKNLLAVGLLVVLSYPLIAQESPPARVTPWTTSNVKGSPDPPLPFKAVRVFSNVVLDHPTDIVWLPDAKRWIATQLNGQIVSFENDPQGAVAEPVLDLKTMPAPPVTGVPAKRGLAILFHRDLENQPWCYVTFTTENKHPQGNHLGRLRVIDPVIPTIDPNSLVVLASWNSEGHSGGSMQFGPDGMLYVSVGDGQNPYPPDALNTGQDLSDLESSVLRIDVDSPTEDAPYRIPPGNPFVGQKNVRPEIWAYGFRNPWKLAFNPESGDLLAADVGWEMREMIHRVRRGRNHGWSLMEGSQPVKQDRKPDSPITPPLFEHTHVDSRSISGGHFWQSDRIADLNGAYIYGDWMTGKVWALKSLGDQVSWQKELVDTPLQIICFMLAPDGEVLIVGYDGTIYRLEPNLATTDVHPFPNVLSKTGLFADLVSQRPERGVIEYEISAHHWADGTRSRQWIGIPDHQQLALRKKDRWDLGHVKGRFVFPVDTVLAKTVSYLTEENNPQSERRIETQLLHRLDDEWRAYNYIWSEDQTDATLQDDVATERQLVIQSPRSPGGRRTQTWRHASRSECLLCHIWSAETIHAFSPDQLNISYRQENQLTRLARLGLFAEPIPARKPIPSPHDGSRSLESRARAYLALNCSTCHRPQGGGTANFNFDLTKSLAENKYVDAVPAQGTFGIPDARVVAPGDPFRSVLLYRMLKSRRGHMPQFGSNVIDIRGVRVLHDWIASIAAHSSPNSNDGGNPSWGDRVATLIGSENSDRQLHELLDSTPDAISLSMACSEESMPDSLRGRIVGLGVTHPDPQIRDLFEHHLPEEQREKLLGPTIDEDALLATSGSAERGKQLFENAKDVNCRLCHRIDDVGQNVGPDLSGIGTQRTPAELLASILRPSETIDVPYRARQILTVDGETIVGLVQSETEQELVIADTTGKSRRVPTDDIDRMQPSPTSMMPDQLLSGMTSTQAADLLAYLGSRRRIGPLQHKHAVIRRAKAKMVVDGKRDEPDWRSAASLGDFVFPWWNAGDGERQQTEAKMLWDDEHLYVSFHCLDTNIQASRTERDSEVYRDDCVEVFASPEIDHPENYFNLEINANGTQLDNYRPDGRNPDTEWNPSGIRCAVIVDGTLNDSSDRDRSWSLEVAIPFRLFEHVLPAGRPQVGDRWRLNLNRLEGEMKIKSQWSQGNRNVPRFHTPDFFGFVEFCD